MKSFAYQALACLAIYLSIRSIVDIADFGQSLTFLSGWFGGAVGLVVIHHIGKVTERRGSSASESQP